MNNYVEANTKEAILLLQNVIKCIATGKYKMVPGSLALDIKTVPGDPDPDGVINTFKAGPVTVAFSYTTPYFGGDDGQSGGSL